MRKHIDFITTQTPVNVKFKMVSNAQLTQNGHIFEIMGAARRLISYDHELTPSLHATSQKCLKFMNDVPQKRMASSWTRGWGMGWSQKRKQDKP
jgi:hypothetical protein